MIDWTILFSTFVIVFLAEVGDKTQLVALSATSTSKHPLVIFIAASLALSLSAVLAAFLGKVTISVVPGFTGYISGLLFLIFGFVILFSKDDPLIKECFLQSISLDNSIAHYLPKIFKDYKDYSYRIMNIMRQEKSHSDIFKYLIKERKFYKDDINTSRELEELKDKLTLDKNILKMPIDKALDDMIEKEKAAIKVYTCIREHLDIEHHKETELQKILTDLIKEEEQHVLFYQTCKKELSNG